ncbi:MAG: hypothetical protein KDA52_24610 [Planctomycetaceae bacterium]|nr:hypothetical protein [Planctomycetaceae bacterium]
MFATRGQVPFRTESMVTEAQAEKWILDCDGSCRDVTFTPTSKDAVVAFLKSLLPEYVVSSALDNNGIDRSPQLQSDDPLQGIDGYIHIVLADGDGMIPHLQLFIDEDRELRQHCLEATFFPNDVDAQQFSLKGFRSLIEAWNAVLKSDDYFVRYENASWDLYDPAGLGVIYSRNQPPVE